MQTGDNIGPSFRLTDGQKRALKKLGIETVRDLLYHFPARYGDIAVMKAIAELAKGDVATLHGRIEKLDMRKSFRTKIAMATATVADSTGKLSLIWFNQPYIAKMIPEGAFVRVEGKVSERKGILYLSNPKIERVNELPVGGEGQLFAGESEGGDEIHSLHPVYPESRGVSSNWLVHAIARCIREGALTSTEDPIPEGILARYHLPTWKTAMVWIHAPRRAADAVSARKRFAFEEVFFIQLEKQKERKVWQKERSFIVDVAASAIETFLKRFPFTLTNAQQRAVDAILSDFRRGMPMSRLLEGDVGSGKTAVAATTAYATVVTRPYGKDFGNLQVAYMTPTEILATQQFENFISFFSHLPINIGFITGSGCKKFPSKVNPRGTTDISRAQLLKWVANGEIPILVGTHALIQKSVKFKHLAYVIIDEQHRFGVQQRRALVRKFGVAPHLLSMTATPIPRTLALTMYGDLDLTLLDEMPLGRKPILTTIVALEGRDTAYEKIRHELVNGRQAYVICPRIDEPDPKKETALQAKSAKAEAVRLKKEVFPEYEIEVLHSKLKNREKEDVMNDFRSGKTHILVATSVVEVGVNIPNATVIVIEGAERFGLAQLHQLRGRVLRSTHQAHCYIFTESKTSVTLKRLTALTEAKNGFELAEYDLKLRGAGQLSGVQQWGVSDVAMEALQNLKMVEAARSEARRLLRQGAVEAEGKTLRAGQKLIPCGTAGCYVPGGRYAHAASVIMSVGTARVAGVPSPLSFIACESSLSSSVLPAVSIAVSSVA
ncbi:MAG: ATP-dependent DNA helicase RecG, partial [Parcubacteria group bacterium Gr01-1014_72]